MRSARCGWSRTRTGRSSNATTTCRSGSPIRPRRRSRRRGASAAKERDNESGLDYFGTRYYASGNGRFTTVDPGHVGGDILNPQSWNGYAYALNNPLRFVDPLGTCSQDASGNYVDGDDAGTLVAPGPCPRGKDGALTIGVTETVSVKSKPAIVALAEGISRGAGPVPDPRFIAGFYGASALGGLGVAGAATVGSGVLDGSSIGVTADVLFAEWGQAWRSPSAKSATHGYNALFRLSTKLRIVCEAARQPLHNSRETLEF